MSDLFSLFKIDKPMDRFTFFKQSVILLVFQIFSVGMYAFLHFKIITPILFLLLFILFLLLVEFPVLYIYYVMSSKRLWSIFGSKVSLIIYLPVFIISIPLIFLLIIEYFLLLILPEKSE